MQARDQSSIVTVEAESVLLLFYILVYAANSLKIDFCLCVLEYAWIPSNTIEIIVEKKWTDSLELLHINPQQFRCVGNSFIGRN